MTTWLPAHERGALVARLRASGCVFAEDEADLLITEAHDPTHLSTMVEQRIAGLPLEQVLGWAMFAGHRVQLTPGVFVPRRRTEALVRIALTLARPNARIVDLCCGSGAVGAAIAREVPGAQLWACDIDPTAVACAQTNLDGLGEALCGDLDAPLPRDLTGRVDLLVANAPYVPTDDIAFMPPEAREYEPTVALDGGSDGLDLHRRVAAIAPHWLAPDGHLLIETSRRQAAGTVAACERAGLTATVRRDEDVDGTVVHAHRPTPGSPAPPA